jgi:HEPN domain-containing protein
MTPSKQERVFKPEYSDELLKIAVGDLGSAEVLLKNFCAENSRAENIFFLAQQSIEKSLKAVLCALQLPVPLVHELGVLVSKLPASANPPFGYELTALSEFAAVRRYEEGALVLTHEEAVDVVKQARIVYAWAESIVKA